MTRTLLVLAVLGLAACHKAPAPSAGGEAAPAPATAPSAVGGGELMPSTDENALPGDGMARGPDAPVASPPPAAPAK